MGTGALRRRRRHARARRGCRRRRQGPALIGARALVPTERQVDVGDVENSAFDPPYADPLASSADDQSTAPSRQRFMEAARFYNPFAVTGSSTPIVVFGSLTFIGIWS